MIKNSYSIRYVLISSVFFISIYYLINFSPIGLSHLLVITHGNTILDMSLFGYSIDKAYQILALLGDEGRAFALNYIMPLDFLFPLSYGIFYFLLLRFLIHKVGIVGSIANIKYIGFIALFADWLENIFIIFLLTNYPSRLDVLSQAASVCTITKTIFTLSCISLILIGIITLIIQNIVRRFTK